MHGQHHEVYVYSIIMETNQIQIDYVFHNKLLLGYAVFMLIIASYFSQKTHSINITYRIIQFPMQEYLQQFSRQTSNARVLNNRHFTNPLSSEYQLNQTEADLQEAPPKKHTTHKEMSALGEDYQPAKYHKALAYKASRSYYLKNNKHFVKIGVLENTDTLKYFGLGPFFYVEFMRWMCWLFFVLTLLEGVRVYLNWKGSGLSDYSVSFSTYLISATLGNFSGKVLADFDIYVVALVPCGVLASAAMANFIWKCYFHCQIKDQEENNYNIKPEKFCFEVASQDQNSKLNQSELRRIFAHFGQVHQVSLVRRFDGKLEYFQELDRLEEKIREEELQLKLEGSKTSEYLQQLKKERQNYSNELKSVNIDTQTLSAYVNFQYQKTKHDSLSYFYNHYLFDSCSHSCMRTCCSCCTEEVDHKLRLNGRSNVLIKNQEVPAPEDINWQSFEITRCGFLARCFFSFILILVFLALSCTIIGLCTIYISTHSSNCDSINVPTSLAAAQAVTDQATLKCYCNANLFNSFTDAGIQALCASYLKDIYIEQAVQIAITLVSTVTNFIFGVVINKIVNCTKPSSHSQSLKSKTIIYSVFLIFNTVFLPILLYSNIFGFKASSYFSFLQIISTDITSFLQISSLEFYMDYSPIWYRNVSPIFTNYIVVDLISLWFMFVVTKCTQNTEGLEEKEGKMLQKHMNKEITSYQLSIYKEYSNFFLIIFMTFYLEAGIPALVPLAFLNLISRYIMNRSLLQQNSTRINGLGLAFNQLSYVFLTITLALSAVNAAWMLTANSLIFPNILHFSMNLGTLNNLSIVERQLYLPFYIGISLVVLGEYLIVELLLSCLGSICRSCYEKKQVIRTSATKSFHEHTKTMNIMTSYNIKNNDNLRNAVIRMEMYTNKNT